MVADSIPEEEKPIYLTSDEIKNIIKTKLLELREVEAEDEIIKLCKQNHIKGEAKAHIQKFYKAEKKEHLTLIKKLEVESEEKPDLRSVYSEIITATDPQTQLKQLQDHIKTAWLDQREDITLIFIKEIFDAFDLDREFKAIIKKFYKAEKTEHDNKKLEAQRNKAVEEKKLRKIEITNSTGYVNDEVKEWENYLLPEIENGYYKFKFPGIVRTFQKSITETGLTIETTVDVCRSPFIICGISEPVNNGPTFFKIRYSDYKGDIKEFWADQGTLLSRKELKTLFNIKGINCPENDLLNETIDYISRSIGEFGSRYKKEFSAQRNGWNEDKTVFVIGDRGIKVNGTEPVLSVGNVKGYPELKKAGTLECWIKGITPYLEHDVLRFKLYDAFTAPLKAVLGVESHITDHYGSTSSGKTLSAWMTLSAFGDPEGLTIGAKSTMKGILVHIRDFSDLPILIDESSDAGEHLTDLIYSLTSNKGRVKSTIDGKRDGGEEYHTSTMFTGEKPLRDCLTNSGQQYRVNELTDTFPDMTTQEINKIKKIMKTNHGHIIDLYIAKIFSLMQDGELENIFDKCFNCLPPTTSNIEGRSKTIFACIMTAGRILENIFAEIGIPEKNPGDIINKYFKINILDNPIEPEYIRALKIVIDWVHSSPGSFGETQTSSNFKRYGYENESHIDIIGTEFTKKMKDEKFSPSKIKADWYNQGIVESNVKGRLGSNIIKKEGKTFAGVTINRVIAEELVGFNQVSKPSDNVMPQDEKIKNIIESVKFLTKINKNDTGAEIKLLRQLLDIPELDELIRILTINGKLIKVNSTTYKPI